jgi:hypothetical protein
MWVRQTSLTANMSSYLLTALAIIIIIIIIICIDLEVHLLKLQTRSYHVGREVRSVCHFLSLHKWIVGSNPGWGLNVCLRLFCFVLSCVGRGLTTGQYSAQGVLPNICKRKREASTTLIRSATYVNTTINIALTNVLVKVVELNETCSTVCFLVLY